MPAPDVWPILPAIPPPYSPFSFPASLYLLFPNEIGTYLCLYICTICRFIVMKKRTPKYINSIGQNTGTSNTEKKVITNAVPTPRVHAIQNLNSGNRRANGRYSFPSLEEVGKLNPSSRLPPTSVGSSNGLRKAMKLFNRKIPSPYATMKYPWMRYMRRKKRARIVAKSIHRGTMWMVDLSSQYWMARRTLADVASRDDESSGSDPSIILTVGLGVVSSGGRAGWSGRGVICYWFYKVLRIRIGFSD
mmetsp:Transcript_3243/g.7198  ORF Transcript_3243/g.7198 Transcript_3243/m.7198 type:complete len:247 (-) Transcript_3243:46-786(-)